MGKHIKAKKWLGQHFLGDASICAKIAALVPQQGAGAALVEVGPGEGALTRFLPTQGYSAVYLLDVDEESVKVLNEKYNAPPYHVQLADFLEADFNAFGSGDVVIAGNFPYNISSQIFFKVLEEFERVPTMVCMVQKEVAKRLASPAGTKEYGILSVLLQAWYRIDYKFTVKPGSFIPPPKVDSGVILLTRNKRMPQDLGIPVSYFNRVVKAAFNQRRKMLRNAVGDFLPAEEADIPFLNKRAEQLSVTEFIELARALFALTKGGSQANLNSIE